MWTFDRALLVTYLRPEWRRAATLAAVLLATIALQLANPQIVAVFINRVQGGADADQLLSVGAIFMTVVLLAQATTVVETYLAEDLGWRSTNTLRADLTRHVLGLDGSFQSAFGPGELIERIDGDVSAVADFFARFVVQLLGSGVFLAGVLVLLFITDWRIGLVMLACSAATMVYLAFGGSPVARRAEQARQAASDLSGYVEERIDGMPDIRPNGAGGYVLARFHERLAALFHANRGAAMAGQLFNGVVGVIFALGTGGSLAVAVILHRNGLMAVGTIYIVFRYTTMLQMPVEQLSRQISGFQQATGGIVRVRRLLSVKSNVASTGTTTPPSGPLSLDFEQVTFGYSDSPVLRDVSFSVRPGEVVGLLGRTGSGKTTISRLLFRLYDVEAGVIRINGSDIRGLDLESTRERIGLVTQDVHLFAGTVRDNVSLFDRSVDDDRLRRAFEQLGLQPWLERQPLGLDTPVGSGGSGLSAGEAQLVALVRVFLKEPGIIVLDEASSRLDPTTQRLIEAGITELLANRTAIVIAHRLETVERADTILILEGGIVAEMGRREELAADPNSRYAGLLRAGMREALA